MSRLFNLVAHPGALSPLAFVPLCRDRAGGSLGPKAWVLCGHVKGGAGCELGYFVS